MSNIVKFLLFPVLALAALGARADQADRYQPMTIDADKVTVDEAKKTSVFQGNVIINQGTMLVRAQRVTYRQDEAGDYFITATGAPITFRQKQDNSPDVIEASAQQLEFNSKTEQARLSGKAVLKRGADQVRGHSIFYDMRTQRYVVDGGSPDGKESGGRVKLVIQPKRKPPEGAPAASASTGAQP